MFKGVFRDPQIRSFLNTYWFYCIFRKNSSMLTSPHEDFCRNNPVLTKKFQKCKDLLFCQNWTVPVKILWKWGWYRRVLSEYAIIWCVFWKVYFGSEDLWIYLNFGYLLYSCFHTTMLPDFYHKTNIIYKWWKALKYRS